MATLALTARSGRPRGRPSSSRRSRSSWHRRRADLHVRLRQRPHPGRAARRPGLGRAPVAPAVDLSILGLLLGTRHLALHGATAAELRPARRLLIFASLTTLALNIADPLVTGAYGKAAFDAVGPLLLIGWAEVEPGFLQPIGAVGAQSHEIAVLAEVGATPVDEDRGTPIGEADSDEQAAPLLADDEHRLLLPEELLVRARREDAAHRAAHQRPISADTLRRRMAICAERSRRLVALVRSEAQAKANGVADDLDGASKNSITQAA
jgi:hypothetical protein